MRGPLTIAVAQPPCAAKDVIANALAHAAAIRAANARVVVFPELSLTGYELGADVVAPDAELLTPIVEACTATDSLALAGAPVAGERGRVHIGMLGVDSTGVHVAYRKCHLGGEEPSRFSPGPGATALDVDGWRIGLGICKDTGVAAHVNATAALGIDAYVAGVVHLADELAVQERRAVSIARRCDAHVAFASFAGPTGGGYDRTAGCSAIWSPTGTVLARASERIGDVAEASIGEPAALRF